MRVMGIDPGSRVMGYGLVEVIGREVRHVTHGVVRVDVDAPLPERLCGIFEQLQLLLSLHRPQEVAVEGVFTFKNARSALVLGQARGVTLLAAAQQGLPVHEYPPAAVKRAVGAGGAGAKGAVARMVQTLLQMEPSLTRIPADATDALAVALCHVGRSRAAVPTSSGRPAPGKGAASLKELVTSAYVPPVGAAR